MGIFVDYKSNHFKGLKNVATTILTADPHPIWVTSFLVCNRGRAPMRFNLQTARMDGLMLEKTCLAASVDDLSTEYVDKGNFGKGDQLVHEGVGVFTVDGVIAPLYSRILVKNQNLQYQNGIYNVTNIGNEISPWVLTRATDFDIASEVNVGDVVSVSSGTVNKNTKWEQTAVVNMVGFDPITFVPETTTDTFIINELEIPPFQTVDITDITGVLQLQYTTLPFTRDSLFCYSNGYTQVFDCIINYAVLNELPITQTI